MCRYRLFVIHGNFSHLSNLAILRNTFFILKSKGYKTTNLQLIIH